MDCSATTGPAKDLSPVDGLWGRGSYALGDDNIPMSIRAEQIGIHELKKGVGGGKCEVEKGWIRVKLAK